MISSDTKPEPMGLGEDILGVSLFQLHGFTTDIWRRNPGEIALGAEDLGEHDLGIAHPSSRWRDGLRTSKVGGDNVQVGNGKS